MAKRGLYIKPTRASLKKGRDLLALSLVTSGLTQSNFGIVKYPTKREIAKAKKQLWKEITTMVKELGMPNEKVKHERVVFEIGGHLHNTRVYLEKSGEELPVVSLCIKARGKCGHDMMTCVIELPPDRFIVKGNMEADIRQAEVKDKP